MINLDEIIEKAWDLYYSPEKEEIADYTKYDALYDVTRELGVSDDEYDKLMEEMRYQ